MIDANGSNAVVAELPSPVVNVGHDPSCRGSMGQQPSPVQPWPRPRPGPGGGTVGVSVAYGSLYVVEEAAALAYGSLEVDEEAAAVDELVAADEVGAGKARVDAASAMMSATMEEAYMVAVSDVELCYNNLLGCCS